MADFTAQERMQAIITLAVADNVAGAAQLLRSDPHPGELLPLLIGLAAGQVREAAVAREMEPSDYWALVVQQSGAT